VSSQTRVQKLEASTGLSPNLEKGTCRGDLRVGDLRFLPLTRQASAIRLWHLAFGNSAFGIPDVRTEMRPPHSYCVQL